MFYILYLFFKSFESLSFVLLCLNNRGKVFEPEKPHLVMPPYQILVKCLKRLLRHAYSDPVAMHLAMGLLVMMLRCCRGCFAKFYLQKHCRIEERNNRKVLAIEDIGNNVNLPTIRFEDKIIEEYDVIQLNL